MNSKASILESVKRSADQRDKVAYPRIPHFESSKLDLLVKFKESLVAAAGTYHHVQNIQEAQEIIKHQLPNINIVCSATKDWNGNKDLSDIQQPQELEDVELGVLRASFGVAETGMIWVTDQDLQVNALGFLSQHLVVLLKPDALTENMHTAYEMVNLNLHNYGTFMMGPSATGDIQATLVQGAQGARTLTVFFL